MSYNLNEVAMITGLTTRTLRNYLKLDLLTGEKIDGNWSFTDEEMDAFMSNPVVKQAIKTKLERQLEAAKKDPSKKGTVSARSWIFLSLTQKRWKRPISSAT